MGLKAPNLKDMQEVAQESVDIKQTVENNNQMAELCAAVMKRAHEGHNETAEYLKISDANAKVFEDAGYALLSLPSNPNMKRISWDPAYTQEPEPEEEDTAGENAGAGEGTSTEPGETTAPPAGNEGQGE